MPPITATVNWPDGQAAPSVDPNPIVVRAGNGATVVQWSCGTNVASFQITGLDSTEFAPSGSNPNVTQFSTTDTNDRALEYSYTVSATHTSGRTARHDPKIQNGGG